MGSRDGITVEESEKFLEGVKERPVRQKTDALADMDGFRSIHLSFAVGYQS